MLTHSVDLHCISVVEQTLHVLFTCNLFEDTCKEVGMNMDSDTCTLRNTVLVSIFVECCKPQKYIYNDHHEIYYSINSQIHVRIK